MGISNFACPELTSRIDLCSQNKSSSPNPQKAALTMATPSFQLLTPNTSTLSLTSLSFTPCIWSKNKGHWLCLQKWTRFRALFPNHLHCGSALSRLICPWNFRGWLSPWSLSIHLCPTTVSSQHRTKIISKHSAHPITPLLKTQQLPVLHESLYYRLQGLAHVGVGYLSHLISCYSPPRSLPRQRPPCYSSSTAGMLPIYHFCTGSSLRLEHSPRQLHGQLFHLQVSVPCILPNGATLATSFKNSNLTLPTPGMLKPLKSRLRFSIFHSASHLLTYYIVGCLF